MTLQNTLGHTVTIGEDGADLVEWLHRQTGCPSLDVTRLLYCRNPAHGAEAPGWFFVEADAGQGVARHRCVACAAEAVVLDSTEHWTYPAMHSCGTCGQSMVELAAGVHTEPDLDGGEERATWVALACRCVACGRIDGLTDIVVTGLSAPELLGQL